MLHLIPIKYINMLTRFSVDEFQTFARSDDVWNPEN